MTMKVRKLDAEDFHFLLGEIQHGTHLEAVDFLSLRQYANDSAMERYQLLNALITGYASHQARIEEKNNRIAELERKLAANKRRPI